MRQSLPDRGIELNVHAEGSGPPVVLLHGFPHTARVWDAVVEDLAADHHVVAPDLRGFGASSRTPEMMDAGTVSHDLEALLEARALRRVLLVALDAGVPPAFLLAVRRPDLVRRVVLVEATLGRLPGADDLLAAGPPWWFGFHAVPGLAERVVAGNEGEYVGWFLDRGTRGRAVAPEVRAAIVRAYTAPGALASALGYYRCLPTSAAQLAAAGRLSVPTTAIGAAPVGPALAAQLAPVTDDLTSLQFHDCGHIVPLDRPDLLVPVLRGGPGRRS